MNRCTFTVRILRVRLFTLFLGFHNINMGAYFYAITTLCVVVTAAPPAPPHLYQQAPAQLKQLHPFEYFVENSEAANYYPGTQRQGELVNGSPSSGSAKLENLDPDSEVELLPGVQPPQQPPQQNPVAPNIPGLLPGQRVFIVHMPVPGYRPGTIMGYQPVYIVAAAPQGNPGYPTNGYQNPIVLDPSGQTVVSPLLLGYPRAGVNGVVQGANPGFPIGAPPPYDIYQNPSVYQNIYPTPQEADAARGALHLSQQVNVQRPLQHSTNLRANTNEKLSSTEPKRPTNNLISKDDEPQRNARPLPAHAQSRVTA